MNESETQSIARRFTECLGNGDLAGVDALYHEDVRVWRNIDGRELVKAQVMKVVRYLAKNVSGLAYEDVKVQSTDSGYVQQHRLTGTAPNGQMVNAHACLIVTLDGAQIRRVDEYLDSAQLAPLMS